MSQKTAELPEQRLFTTLPFYRCGKDVFRQFNIRNGKVTRANTGVKMQWVRLFSCLYSRAVHLETLDSIDTASLQLAFNGFQAIRWDFTYLRSDQGSKFIVARNDQPQEDQIVPDNAINEVCRNWELQGRIWDLNTHRLPTSDEYGKGLQARYAIYLKDTFFLNKTECLQEKNFNYAANFCPHS